MKLKFVCDSGANIHSAKEKIIDLEDLNISDEEWKMMNDEYRYKIVEEWAWENGLEVYWEYL